MDIIILPAVVQGSDAAESIATRIKEVNDFLLAPVMIVGRGGGSIEDLLPFSEDCVIEAIHQSNIPVISAVGHEIDWALSDFVADLRAPTPSAAAELVCDDALNLKASLDKIRTSMKESLLSKISTIRLRLKSFSPSYVENQIQSRISHNRMRLDYGVSSLKAGMSNLISNKKTRLNITYHRIQALSPLAVLERGYSIITNSKGETVKNIKQLSVRDSIIVQLSDGTITSEVTKISENLEN